MTLLTAVVANATASSLDTPARTGQTSPTDVAVVIALEDYAFLPDVPHARADADAFADFLRYTRGLAADRILRVDSGRNGSREHILQILDEAKGLAGQDALLWVYFAGHGAASPADGARLLLGDDVRPDTTSFESRSVRVDDVARVASSSGARVMLVLDTCYTGAGRTGEALIPGGRFAIPSFAVKPPGTVVEWSAASANEISGPLPGAGHGAFTWYVVGALRGWADGEVDGRTDGVVTADEAQAYVDRSLRAGGVQTQHPVWSGDASARGWTLATGVSEREPTLDLASAPASPPRAAAAPSTPAAAPARPPMLGGTQVSFAGTYYADGPHDPGMIASTVESKFPAIAACVDARPALSSGMLKFAFSIRKDGTVPEPIVTLKQARDPALVECVRAILSATLFEPAPRNTFVSSLEVQFAKP